METHPKIKYTFISMLNFAAIANLFSLLCLFRDHILLFDILSIPVLLLNIGLLLLFPIILVVKLALSKQTDADGKIILFFKLLIYFCLLEIPSCILFILLLTESGI